MFLVVVDGAQCYVLAWVLVSGEDTSTTGCCKGVSFAGRECWAEVYFVVCAINDCCDRVGGFVVL